jgi:hypothetical protein
MKEPIYDLVDPLGEIRNLARQLFEDAGAPAGKSWKDFYSEAESKMLTVAEKPAHSAAYKSAGENPVSINPQLAQIIESSEDPFIKILASSFTDLLSLHEAICLSHFLFDNKIILTSGVELQTNSVAEHSSILSLLGAELDQGYLDKLKKTTAQLSTAEKMLFWKEYLTNEIQADNPLNFNQQNTIRRLRSLIEKNPLVKEVQFIQAPSELK